MRTFLSSLILFSLTLCAFPALAGDLREENKLLESEVKLAKTDKIYFVFDLGEGAVYFKARGVVLKKLDIRKARVWGRSPELKPRALVKKTTLFKPKREKLKPGEAAGEDFELDALELKDMPSSYGMIFDGGVNLSVGPAPEGVFSRISGALGTLGWYLTRPVYTIWNAVRGKPFFSVRLALSKQDAQALYWALPEGIEAIVYRPTT